MPRLTFRGITAGQVKAIGTALTAELAELCRCPQDDFLLEVLHTTAVFQGETAPSFPFVEVAWFDRGTETRDRFAEILDRHLRRAGATEAEIAFRVYREDHYYLNGKHFGEIKEKTAAEWERELEAEKQANARLRGQLRQAARKSSSPGTDNAMSIRLRDALRE